MIKIKELTIEITNQCPNHCIYCSGNCGVNGKTFLTYEEVKKIALDAKECGVERINISGGEPFLNIELVPMCAFIRSLIPNVKLYIYTSGLVFHQDTETRTQSIPSSTMKLLSYFVDTIVFNVQSADSSKYDLICNDMKESHRLFQLSCSIRWARQYGMKAEINFIVMKQNFEEIGNIYDFAQVNKISKINFMRLVKQGRACEYECEITGDELAKVKKEISLLQKIHPDKIKIGIGLLNENNECLCVPNFEKLIISSTGKFYPCEIFKSYDTKGFNNDIFQYSDCNVIKAAMESVFFVEIKRNLSKITSSCDSCIAQENLKESD